METERARLNRGTFLESKIIELVLSKTGGSEGWEGRQCHRNKNDVRTDSWDERVTGGRLRTDELTQIILLFLPNDL